MDLISFGSVFLELVFGHVRELPLPGEEVFTDEFAISCGGALTSATAAAQAGAQVGVCTVLGDDFGSRVVIGHCARHGVDLSLSELAPGRAVGITVVLNFEGDRAFITHMPPRSADQRPQIDHWREVLRRARPRWCYVHADEGVADLLREARVVGTKVALDMTLQAARRRETVVECVRLADVFVPNEAELLGLTCSDTLESAVSAAQAWGTPLVVKRGSAGAVVVDRGRATDVADGIRPVEVRDLTGAGDTFTGAMVAALLRGAPLTAAVVAANAAGSEAVSRLGAVGEVDTSRIGGADWATRESILRQAFIGGPFAGGAEGRGEAGDDSAGLGHACDLTDDNNLARGIRFRDRAEEA